MLLYLPTCTLPFPKRETFPHDPHFQRLLRGAKAVVPFPRDLGPHDVEYRYAKQTDNKKMVYSISKKCFSTYKYFLNQFTLQLYLYYALKMFVNATNFNIKSFIHEYRFAFQQVC